MVWRTTTHVYDLLIYHSWGCFTASRFAARSIIYLSNLLFSLSAVTMLFAIPYKWLPNAPIAWKDLWIGAIITAILFTAGAMQSDSTWVGLRSHQPSAQLVPSSCSCSGFTTLHKCFCSARSLPTYLRRTARVVEVVRTQGRGQDSR